MPELPEVETVRRGLEPAMDGARFSKVELRRGDLRWPLPKDFVARLEGKTVTGLGRRAKYLLTDLSSGDVLVMHLGMSGSFHVFEKERQTAPGAYYHELAKHKAHDHVVFHMSSGAIVTFNDPRRFGSMKIVPRNKLDAEPLLPIALGASIEVHAQALAAQGARSEAVLFLRDQAKLFAGTSIVERVRKNLNLLSLEGKPAPELDESEWLGSKPPNS